jgi:hypothetical protein
MRRVGSRDRNPISAALVPRDGLPAVVGVALKAPFRIDAMRVLTGGA